MRREGITADRSIARGFAYEGYDNLKEGNYERARESFGLAIRFDPMLADAQFGYAWSLLKAGRGFFAFLDEYARGLKLSWRGFATDQIFLANFMVVTAVACFGGMSLIALLIILRCQPRFRHDVQERVVAHVGQNWARFTGWLVFLLPLCFWIGGVWLMMFWLLVTFRYMRRLERFVAGAVFVMIALAPLGVDLVLERFQTTTDQDTRVVLSAVREGYNPTTMDALQRIVADHPDAAELRLLLGLLYAKADRQAEAYDAFRAVLDLRPTSVAALVNVGNVYARLGEFGEAVNRYKEAAEIQPDLISAWWNLYLAQTELLHFAEAESSLNRAREIDSGRVGELLSQKKDAGTGEPVFEPAVIRNLRAELRGERLTPAGLAARLLNPVSVASGVCLLVAVILSLGTHGVAIVCRSCGRAYCWRCAVDGPDPGYCARCVHLLLKRDQVTHDVRVDEMARLQRRDRFRAASRRLSSLVMPGAGLILADRSAVGVPVLGAWLLLGLHLVARQKLLLSPRVPVLDNPDPLVVIAGLVMVFLWLCGNILLVRARFGREGTHGA